MVAFKVIELLAVNVLVEKALRVAAELILRASPALRVVT